MTHRTKDAVSRALAALREADECVQADLKDRFSRASYWSIQDKALARIEFQVGSALDLIKKADALCNRTEE